MNILPNFIMPGTAKAGTSFLLKYLRQHPDIYLPKSNELYFHSNLKNFNGPHDRSSEKKQTLSLKNYIDNFKMHTGQKVIGEFATDYLYDYKESIKSIKKILGEDVKVIIILRNPIERTFSQYKHMVSKFHESLNFWDALYAEEKRKRQKWRWTYQYIQVSMYYEQVKAYLKAFNNVHIVIYEDLKVNPIVTINNIYRFLEVEQVHFDNITEKVNVKKVHSNKLSSQIYRYLSFLEKKLYKKTFLSEKIYYLNNKNLSLIHEDKLKLYEIFKSEIEKLEQLLNISLERWKIK